MSGPVPLRRFLLYFLRLGALGFGGPIALAGYMQRDLVERRGWISREDYVEGLALSQLSPGPLAAQLAMYLGWVRGRALGAALVGAAFIAPSFAIVMVLSFLYLRFGGLSWIQGLFYGVGASVIAIIGRSAVRLARLTLGRDVLLWVIFALTAAVTALTGSEIVWVFVLSGTAAMAVKAPPRILSRGQGPVLLSAVPALLMSGLHGPASAKTIGTIAWYFTEAGAFVFGSGLAIVPFLYGGVVREFHWLNERQFFDAVAVAMITPGPVVITAGFIGYLTAGVLGAMTAAGCTFIPPYLVVVLAAHAVRKAKENKSLRAFIAGVTAAATGAIAGAAIVLGRRELVDLPTVIICLATLGVSHWIKKVPEPLTILTAGATGLILKGLF